MRANAAYLEWFATQGAQRVNPLQAIHTRRVQSMAAPQHLHVLVEALETYAAVLNFTGHILREIQIALWAHSNSIS